MLFSKIEEKFAQSGNGMQSAVLFAAYARDGDYSFHTALSLSLSLSLSLLLSLFQLPLSKQSSDRPVSLWDRRTKFIPCMRTVPFQSLSLSFSLSLASALPFPSIHRTNFSFRAPRTNGRSLLLMIQASVPCRGGHWHGSLSLSRARALARSLPPSSLLKLFDGQTDKGM